MRAKGPGTKRGSRSRPPPVREVDTMPDNRVESALPHGRDLETLKDQPANGRVMLADLILPDGSEVCYVVAYRDLNGTYRADPNVAEDFEEALQVAAEIMADDEATDPRIIQVLLAPERLGV